MPKQKPLVKLPLKPRRKKKPAMSSPPSSVLASNSNPSHPPVPKPRKKPPPKPAPYRQHVVNKSEEITTFKSNMPTTQPRPLSPLDALSSTTYATVEEKAQNRKSIKGDPSEAFYSPVRTTPEPVEYKVPSFPIDRRPRLSTPHHPTEPEVSPAGGTSASKLGSTPEGEESPSQVTPSPFGYDVVSAGVTVEARPRIGTPASPSSPQSTVHLPHDKSSSVVDSRPRLKTPHVPPDPDKVVRSSPKVPTPQARARRRPPPSPGGRKELATAEEQDDKKVASLTASASKSEGGVESSGNSCVYAVVDTATKRSVVEASAKKQPSSSSSLHSPAEEQATPTEVRDDAVEVNGVDETLSAKETSSSGAAYNVTTHVSRSKLSTSDLPMATPPTSPSVDEYNITTHDHRTSATSLQEAGEEYSKLPSSPEAAQNTPTPSTEDGYSVTSHGTNQNAAIGILQSSVEEDYSKLPSSPTDTAPVEGYSMLGGVVKVGPAGGQTGAIVPEPVQDPEYEVVREPPRPLRPPRPGTRSRQPDGSPMTQSPSGNVSAKKPKPKPAKPPRGNLMSSSPQSVARNTGPPGSISPKPHRKMPPAPGVAPKPWSSPKPGERSPKILIPNKPKPPPPATKPSWGESPRRQRDPRASEAERCENAPTPSKTPPSSSSGGVARAVTPMVEVDVDKIRAMMGRANEGDDTRREGKVQEVGGDARRRSYENQDVIATASPSHKDDLGKRRSYENQDVIATASPSHKDDLGKRRSYENQDVIAASSSPNHKDELSKRRSYENQDVVEAAASSVPPRTPPPEDGGLGGASYGSPLTPSEVFTVPQHAVPGPHNYCEIDVDNISSSSLATPPHSATRVSESGDAVVMTSSVYPNSRGYFDISVRNERKKSRENGEGDSAVEEEKSPEEGHGLETGDHELENGGIQENGEEERNEHPSTDLVLDESGVLANGLLHKNQLSSPPMSETAPISTASASLVTSSETIAVQAAEGVANESGRGNQRAKASGSEGDDNNSLEDSGSPRTKRPSGSGFKVKGGKQYGPRRALSAKRRPPPPPPPPSTPRPALPKAASQDSNSESSTKLGTSSEDRMLRSGLCTLPRAKRTGGGAPLRAARPPPPPVPYNAQKKREQAGKTRPQPPPPPPGPLPHAHPAPPSSPPSSSSSSATSPGLFLGPPQGLVSSTELSSQPGLKKKLMGFFKMSNPTDEPKQEFGRQSSFRRSKKKSKVKADVDLSERGRSESMTKTLPRNMGSKLQSGVGGSMRNFGLELAAEDEGPAEDLEFGIYSTISDSRKGAKASPPVSAKSIKVSNM